MSQITKSPCTVAASATAPRMDVARNTCYTRTAPESSYWLDIRVNCNDAVQMMHGKLKDVSTRYTRTKLTRKQQQFVCTHGISFGSPFHLYKSEGDSILWQRVGARDVSPLHLGTPGQITVDFEHQSNDTNKTLPVPKIIFYFVILKDFKVF